MHGVQEVGPRSMGYRIGLAGVWQCTECGGCFGRALAGLAFDFHSVFSRIVRPMDSRNPGSLSAIGAGRSATGTYGSAFDFAPGQLGPFNSSIRNGAGHTRFRGGWNHGCSEQSECGRRPAAHFDGCTTRYVWL